MNDVLFCPEWAIEVLAEYGSREMRGEKLTLAESADRAILRGLLGAMKKEGGVTNSVDRIGSVNSFCGRPVEDWLAIQDWLRERTTKTGTLVEMAERVMEATALREASVHRAEVPAAECRQCAWRGAIEQLGPHVEQIHGFGKINREDIGAAEERGRESGRQELLRCAEDWSGCTDPDEEPRTLADWVAHARRRHTPSGESKCSTT